MDHPAWKARTGAAVLSPTLLRNEPPDFRHQQLDGDMLEATTDPNETEMICPEGE